jgi:2-polyprenyl-3-methyl-5-hydroxy-6-metoxy-1,4-benzoquinol methylase
MDTVSWENYDTHSEQFFQTYEGLNFSKIHRAFLRFLPSKGARCLDIGAGSGRDAHALARRGYWVTAVEPSNPMRHLAKTTHRHPRILWINDSLPALTHVLSLHIKYEFILLSAIWMHIHPNRREEAFNTLAFLLAPHGHVALTIRFGPASRERMIYSVAMEELIAQARRRGLFPVYISRVMNDPMSRDEVTWKKIVFTK